MVMSTAPSSSRCSGCGQALRPDAQRCPACGIPVSGARVTWQAPLPSPSPTMDTRRHADAAADFQPLQLPPDTSRRDRFARLGLALLATLASGALLALAEILLRDGYDRFSWGIVWFASLGALALAILGWCVAATRALRHRARRWRRHR